MRRISNLSSLTLLTIATGLFVVVPQLGVAWSGASSVTLTSMTMYQSGKASPPGVLIQFSPAGTDTEGCAHSNQGSAWIDYSTTGEPDGKAMYATVLVAQTAGKSVSFGLNGCSSNGFPVVYAVSVPGG